VSERAASLLAIGGVEPITKARYRWSFRSTRESGSPTPHGVSGRVLRISHTGRAAGTLGPWDIVGSALLLSGVMPDV
jgi:hypothetical protein